MSNPIERRLAYEDDHQHRRIIGQKEIAAIVQPVVILGDPGLGKSFLAESLEAQPNMKYCRAGKFGRADRPETLIAQGERIIVDGLDEIASSTPGGAVDSVLRQLSRMGSPPFILTCRAADWNGAADRIRIEDDYGSAPVLLHLQPFSRDDARLFLSNEFPAIDAASIVDHLASRGLDGIYQNPLTLRLLGEVAHQTGTLPERRAELLERACSVMLPEKNPRHQDDSHVHRSDEELLLAAGAICATLVLCARSGVCAVPYAATPEDCVNVADVTRLPFGEAAEDALRTRLFPADGENRSAYIHRVVAEYLGAKWLVACFDSGRSERRIFSLFRPGDGVPTSLRGLHAWLAHFSPALATRCIAADPYAVLRYGDAETINLDQARALLVALTNLAEDDPYFAAEDWGRHPASALMRTELKEEILTLLAGPERNLHLSVLLLVAMAGTTLAKELSGTLTAMLFDQSRPFDERSSVANALQATDTVDDWEAVIHRLLAMGDADSAGLACDLVADISTRKVSIQTGVDAVLAYLRISVRDVPRLDALVTRDIRDDLFIDLDTVQTGILLDHIAASAPPLMDGPDHSATSGMADLVRRLVSRLLDAEPNVEPERVWAWIGWLDGSAGYNDCNKRRLASQLCENRALRAALLEHVLLTLCARSTWMAAWSLDDTHLDLFPTHEDLVVLLHALRPRSADGPMDEETWRQLVLLGRTPDGIGDVVREAAIETANGNAELLAILDEVSRDHGPERRARRAQREDRAEARIQAFCRAQRALFAVQPHAVAAGDVQLLTVPAEVYLGRSHETFDSSLSPEVRLCELLGWPTVATPTGVIVGSRNPWYACKFIERAIHAISSRPTPDATEALRRLIEGLAMSYADTARHALALQRKARRDFGYIAPSVPELQAVLTDDLPETIDDMRALIADYLDALQERMHASNTDMWEAYWTEEGPRGEEYCRNRLVEQLAGLMPDAIRLEPEMRMPERRRADIVAIRNAVGLPVEIKGQWHREVWSAASDQLDTYYAREWHAQGRGVYLVLWFGDVPGKQLRRHPEQRERPQTPQALRQMLVDRLPEARRLQIDVFVADVTRPVGQA